MNQKSETKYLKNLFLLRHAKSSWKDENISDHERPLNERGRNDSPKMGKFLKKKDLIPDIIVSSPARRAIDTAKNVSEFCGYDKEKIVKEPLLYDSNTQKYLEVISKIPNNYNRVLIVGHNPILEDLLEILTNRIERIPTCTLIWIAFDIFNWNSIINISIAKSLLMNIWKIKEL